MPDLHVSDANFFRSDSANGIVAPRLFRWNREPSTKPTIFTDQMIFSAAPSSTAETKFAWLLESPAYTWQCYQDIHKVQQNFDRVFTFHRPLLEQYSHFEFFPIGGSWLHIPHRVLYPKTKMTSLLASSKNFMHGHSVRHDIKARGLTVDYFGFGEGDHYENKHNALKDYRFSVVVENTKQDYYFTEKIIDAFVTGTVPIYWGCPSIGKFFNTEGMIIFDTIDELMRIVPALTVADYIKRLPAIRQNYALAMDLVSPDDRMFALINGIAHPGIKQWAIPSV